MYNWSLVFTVYLDWNNSGKSMTKIFLSKCSFSGVAFIFLFRTVEWIWQVANNCVELGQLILHLYFLEEYLYPISIHISGSEPIVPLIYQWKITSHHIVSFSTLSAMHYYNLRKSSFLQGVAFCKQFCCPRSFVAYCLNTQCVIFMSARSWYKILNGISVNARY